MIELDHAAFAAHTNALAERAEALRGLVDGVNADAVLLLGGWHGRAASRAGAEAEEWATAARAVVADLTATVDALEASRADLTRADDGAADAHLRLLGRLS